jgi:hypothetical protein
LHGAAAVVATPLAAVVLPVAARWPLLDVQAAMLNSVAALTIRARRIGRRIAEERRRC